MGASLYLLEAGRFDCNATSVLYGPRMNHAILTWGHRRFYSHSSLYVVGRGVEAVSVPHCTLVEASHGACLHKSSMQLRILRVAVITH
jgi:hypothetical protein